jgi:regulator of sirC expression with transglutaminase-like and TPR domain
MINFLSLAMVLSPVPSESKLSALYNSLDRHSIAEHLAFYELYPDTRLGRLALKEAHDLMSNPIKKNSEITLSPLTPSTLSALIALVNKPVDSAPPSLTQPQLEAIERIASHLPHKQLRGHFCTSEEQMIKLPPEEVDLARGVFLSQYGSDLSKVRSYEAVIDLMALQILAKLPKNPSSEEKIRGISAFIFDEMRFRFPPHSLYTKDIDLYTFLPSVIDSRRGVCLGVSILYISLAQRLALSLEMITPPGHIYVRHKTAEKITNIETTAGGIHIDCEDYLNIETRSLQERNLKEVIGLAHFNQASVFMQREDYLEALNSYKKAELYLPNDILLKELLAFAHLFAGQLQEGENLLREIKDQIPDHAITCDSIPSDYLAGKVDIETLKIMHKPVNEDRASILAKKELLEGAVARFPQFRAGIFLLAVTWMQLHRTDKALELLKQAHALDPEDAEGNYYLSVLHIQRLDYSRAWDHLLKAEKIVKARQYQPKVLKELRKNLSEISPE